VLDWTAVMELTEQAPAPSAEGWSKIIQPKRPWFDLQFGELWRYRDLITLLAHRDLATSYKQTVLGPLWFIVQPLMVTAVFSYLFGRMARFGSDDIPHYLFYMGGLVPWSFFAESVMKTSNVFVQNANLFGKVYFPRLSVPLSSLLTNLVTMAVQWALFLAGLGFYLWKHDRFTHPNWWILATPLVFVQLAALGLGIGCIVSALSRRFLDLSFGIKIGMQLWMFGSAIVFPLSRIADNDRWLFLLNPVVPPIEFFRYAFVGKSLVEPWQLGVSALVSVIVLAFGLVLFHRAEQNAMDTV
jgi:lipopolysaccharide transport system permease protein